MGLDGILFYKLSNELNYLSTGKIDKIQEVSDNEFLFTIRRERTNYKLLISLTANFPRINLTTDSFSFPREPKRFTMLLRKYFEGSVIDSITTHETDRIMTIATSRYDELGDFTRTNLVVEIMGRYSNLIVVQDNYVLDALRHIGVSEMRSVMPNSLYTYPDTLGKVNPFNYDLNSFRKLLSSSNSPKETCAILLGVSYQTCLDAYLDNDPVKKLYELINSNIPSLILEPKKDISYYQKNNSTTYESYSSLIDNFYKAESLNDRIKSKTNN
ncbi:MAG: NFACT family protein, partial [Acholeplasmatales bacterium]|nr:NFACT family protein [Acholeplasmatales bacterium]